MYVLKAGNIENVPVGVRSCWGWGGWGYVCPEIPELLYCFHFLSNIIDIMANGNSLFRLNPIESDSIPFSTKNLW